MPASVQLCSRAEASFWAVRPSTSYSSHNNVASLSASKSVSATFSHRKAAVSFMLIIFEKSIFSFPSATMTFSPQMFLSTNPFFILIIVFFCFAAK